MIVLPTGAIVTLIIVAVLLILMLIILLVRLEGFGGILFIDKTMFRFAVSVENVINVHDGQEINR